MQQATSSRETESHRPFNSRKLLESENGLLGFLVTSLSARHGKQDRKWYGDDHREARLGGQVLCVWGKRGWIISCSTTSSHLWVKDCLLGLKHPQFDSQWSCKCDHTPVSTWDLHLQYSPKTSGRLTFDLLRTYCRSGCIWHIVRWQFYCRGNRTATVSLVFPAEDDGVDLVQCRVELKVPAAYQQDLAAVQTICLH